MSSRPAAGPSRSSTRASQEATRLAAEQAGRRRRDRNVLLGVVLSLVLVVVGGGIGLQAHRTNRAPDAAIPGVAITEAPQPVTAGQPVRFGPDSAPVKATLYEDFHCPHCADFETELGPTLTAAQDAGTVQTEILPMSFVDEGSTAAANAFGCATEAGFGQRYHLGLFANHTLQWSDSQLLALVPKVGATPSDAFSACVTGRAKAGWVDSVNAAADAKGVNQTPTLLLDGAPVAVEGLSPAALQTMIDSASSAK